MSYRVALHIPFPGGGTDWYRASGPLGHLQRHRADLFGGGFIRNVGFEFHTIDQVSTSMAAITDMAFFQRPTSAMEVNMMRTFRRLGVPVVVDYDDDYFSVPNDNPSYFDCRDKETIQAVVTALGEATAVIVSTPVLAQRVLVLFPQQKVFVVRNALDERLYPSLQEPKTETVMWRGSGSHQRDIYTYKDALQRFALRNDSAHLTFFGYYPWFLDIPNGKMTVRAPERVVTEYQAALLRTAPRFGIVPLLDNEFNRSKSNVAWLELAAAGAITLVPDWPEWQQPGAIQYNPADFLHQLEWMVQLSPEAQHELRIAQWTAIQERFTLKAVNPLRERIFLAMLGKGEWPAQEIPAK